MKSLLIAGIVMIFLLLGNHIPNMADANNGIRIIGSMSTQDDEITILLENKSKTLFSELYIFSFDAEIKGVLTPDGWHAEIQEPAIKRSVTEIIITSEREISTPVSSLQFVIKINGSEEMKAKWTAVEVHLGPISSMKLVARGAFKVINHASQNAPSNVKCDGKPVPSLTDKSGIPVLLMQPNSTATVCVTYQFFSNWATFPDKEVFPEGIAHFGLGIGKFNKDTPPDLFGITTIPNMLNFTGATNGTRFTIMYKIYATPNSKGFYDHSVPAFPCSTYPMAVGYAATQVKASDFPLLPIAPPCASILYKVVSVRIFGMDYTQIVFPPP